MPSDQASIPVQPIKGTKGLSSFGGKISPIQLLLIGSTIAIFSASALVYGGVTIEKPLEVTNTGGTGTGPTAPPEFSSSTGTIFILAFMALIIGFAAFGFLREAYKHVKAPAEQDKSATESGSEEEGWEEYPGKKEESEGPISAPAPTTQTNEP